MRVYPHYVALVYRTVLQVEGTLRYNGLEPGRDFVVERAAAYIDQV